MHLDAAQMAPAWLDRSAYPWAGRLVPVADAVVHVVDVGTGPTLLLLHGNPTWSFEWSGVIERLSGEFRCVALDLPGFGLSTAGPGFGGSPRDHGRAVADVVRALDLRDWTLVGHDWGIPIGLTAALADPARLAGLAVANSWAWPVATDRHFTTFSRLMGGPLGRLGARRANLVVRAMLPRGHRRRRVGRDELRQYLAPLDTPQRRAATARFAAEIVASSDHLRELEAALPSFAHLPALLLWTDADIAFRETELRRWQDALPDAALVRLPGVGHFVPSDAPDDVATAIRAWHRGRDAAPAATVPHADGTTP